MASFELYRHFDCDDVLLYIGQSYSAYKRLTEGHKRTAHWYESIVRQEIERFPSQQALDDAEVEAIKKEKPMHNIQHNGKSRRKQLVCVSKDGDEYEIPATPKKMRMTALIGAKGEDAFAEKIFELLSGELRYVDDALFGFDQYVTCDRFEYYERCGWGISDDELGCEIFIPGEFYFNCPNEAGESIDIPYPTKKEAKRIIDMVRSKLDGRLPEFDDEKQSSYAAQRMQYILGYPSGPLIEELLSFRRKKEPNMKIKEKTPHAKFISSFPQLLAAIGGEERFLQECAVYIAERPVNIQLLKDGQRRDAVWTFEEYILETGDRWYEGPSTLMNCCSCAVYTIASDLTARLKGEGEKTILPSKREYEKLTQSLKKNLYTLRPTLSGDKKKLAAWEKADCYPFLWSFTGKLEQQEEKYAGNI